MNKGLLQFNLARGNINQGTFRILYYQYKEYIVPVVVIIASLALFMVVCAPMIEAILLLPNQEKALLNRISVLEQNTNFLHSLDERDLDSKLKLVSKALPPGKDYAGIIGALSGAASSSGVNLGDFSLNIGDLFEPKEGGSLLEMEMKISVAGSMAATKKFIDELALRLPLSQVRSVQLSQTASSVSIVFYYRPLPKLVLDESKTLQPLSAKETKVIEDLSGFQ